jgi:hypothetical protein
MRLRRQIENRASHHSPRIAFGAATDAKQRPSFQSDPSLSKNKKDAESKAHKRPNLPRTLHFALYRFANGSRNSI